MKKGVIVLLLVFSLVFVSADACDLSVSLLNQDPYPAVPGDYVKLVFQIDGLDSPDCSDVTFHLLQDYPIELDPGEDGVRRFSKIDYVKDYESNLLIPYEVRIDENALDGANPIEATIENKGDAPLSQTFIIEIEDVRADFEVYIKNYNYQTHELELEILNIVESDVEALTVEIPKQGGINVKGSNRIVVGDLDSNEYTSADFEATLSDGSISVNLIYSDTINVRRTTTKTIIFDSSYFTERVTDKKPTSIWTYLFWGAAIIFVIVFFHKKRAKKKV
ncbi:hypothetical protein KAJ38_00310 [Candidatus Pacearchaeota archaeon]|nr:hypothetical protein [Candidatus Pacearchaeota archaeon]